MPSFSRHDIDNFAFKAVKSLQQGTPLQESVVKLATENSMNPEQIKRLVESTNTSAFLDSFKSKTGNQRMVEFDVADAAKAISSSLGSGDSITITISKDGAPSGDETLFDTIKDEFAPKVASYGLEKVAYSNKPERPKKKETKLSSYMSNKYKESLLDKVADFNYRASDLADEVSSYFKGIYSRDKYASFELDALSRYGNAAMPALHMVRARLGMNKIARKLNPSEEYYLADRHVIEESNKDLLSKVAEISELTTGYKKATNGIEYLNSTKFKGTI